MSALIQKWALTNPEKKAAHRAVKSAVDSGRLKRQGCERCSVRAHAHHDDYSKPLDVRWLCPLHHKEAHKYLEAPK